MRILLISALYPPYAIGGAEICAQNQTEWLRGKGHEIRVLAVANAISSVTAPSDSPLDVTRISPPRPYPVGDFQTVSAWKKPIWHLLDHTAPQNSSLVASVLDEMKPDFVIIHYLQGIGYNALNEIAKRDIPTMYVLHDLGLACVRMSMFKSGKECQSHCTACKVSTEYKKDLVSRIPRIGFCSPSKANMDNLAIHFPVYSYPTAVILNPNKYPAPRITYSPNKVPKILYVGRIHASKGVELLLAAARNLSRSLTFQLTMVGSGPLEAALREEYGNEPWCTFTGNVSQEAVADHMAVSDFLCTPSIWQENSPGVVIQALSLGLPVLGSNKGGIPELVKHDANGLLVEAGDAAQWEAALSRALTRPHEREAWRQYATAHAHTFDQDFLGEQVLGFMDRISTHKDRG